MNIEMNELLQLMKCSQTTGRSADSMPIEGTQIVVLDRGFVYVGTVTVGTQFVTIKNARNIRRWGTTKGLGELADGPTSDTVLDHVGEVVAPMRAVIHFIKCTRDW
jgi:hypothetical protein